MSRGRSRKRQYPDDGWGGFGGYMRAKTLKLENQFQQEVSRNHEKAGTSSSIFKGVSIYVNGYTDPPAAVLKQLMMTHGGRYIYYPNKTNTTHIIASNLAYAKIKELKNEKVVTPNWITDSIKAGKLLPYASYLLYRPKASNQTIHRYASTSNQADGVDEWKESSTDQDVGADVVAGENMTSRSDAVRDDNGADSGAATSATGSRNIDGSVIPISVAGHHGHSPAEDSIPESKLIAEESSSETGSNTRKSDTLANALGGQNGGAFPKSNDPSFLSEFYSHSRLHYISTWGAEYKAFVNELQKSGDRSFPGRKRLMELVRADRDCNLDEQGEEEGMGTLPSHHTKGKKEDRVIMHIDMDCFFVSVSLLKYPELRGKPVAVTHSKGKSMPETNQESREYEGAYYAKKMGTSEGFSKHDEMKGNKETAASPADASTEVPKAADGMQTADGDANRSSEKVRASFNSMAEIASCSYEARRAGVKNGMFMGTAKELCPELETIPYDFEGYQRVSRCLYETVASYTHDIEAVSCDEMLVDITSILTETGVQPLEFADLLREEVFTKTQCHASTGLASNILLARMSTKLAKPNGMFHMSDHNVEDFMKDKAVRDLPGVGWSTNRKFKEMGILNCGDLQKLSLASLQKDFGSKTGQQLYSHCRGIDDRPIRTERERKSVSAEVNYGIRFKGDEESLRFISELAVEVHRRLQNLNMVGRTITVKLKVRQAGAPKEASKFMGHGVCDDKARSITMGQETDDLSVVQRESKALFLQMRVRPEDVRGVGIQISRLMNKSHQPLASKSLVDMLPKKSDIPSAVQKKIPDVTKTQASPVQDSKPVVKTSSLLNFVTKSRKDSPTKAGPTRDISPRKEPTLPRLPTLESPPASQEVVRSKTAPRTVPTSRCDINLPSPSQLDMSVLDSLPPDIRSQILKEYQHSDVFKRQLQVRLHRIDQASTSSGITSNLDQEVLQHLPPEILREVLENEGKQEKRLPPRTVVQNLGPVEELPSFSQLDPSCLEALPEDVRKELNMAYEKKSQLKPTPKKTSPSPRKQSTPFKISRRKGRPKKGSPSKLPWQRNILDAFSIQESPTKSGSSGTEAANGGYSNQEQERKWNVQGDASDASEGKTVKAITKVESTEGSKDSENQGNGKRVADRVAEHNTAVSLSGAVTLPDVKALLREWTGTFQNPLEDDIGIVVQYLRELILEKNLEMVHLVLRGLKRIVTRSRSSEWMEACRVITGRVQNTVQQIYGADLKFD